MARYFGELTHVAAFGLFFFSDISLRASTLGVQAWRLVHQVLSLHLWAGQ